MRSFLLLSVLFFSCAGGLRAQQPVKIKADSTITKPADTLRKKRPVYINPGKVAGRKAIFRSLIVPGMGQIGNGVTVYRLAKVAGVYTGATLLTISFIDNSKNYNLVLDELTYRAKNGVPNPNGPLKGRQDEGLILAKDTFRRNKEVIIFSYVGLYLLTAVEAYIDARLKYFDVDDIAFRVSPGLIDTSSPMYGYSQPVAGIKLTLKF
jgi:hypothetical protein